MKKALYLIALIYVYGFSGTAQAAEPFGAWLAGFYEEAWKAGISREILDQALDGVEPIPRVVELDRKQPEGTMTFAKYKKRVINQKRIDDGRALYLKHKALLDKTSAQYGVPASVIVSLWGLETSYGGNTGGFSVVQALATLAYDGRRSSFFRKELLSALKILDEGHITPAKMKGSWAGAMGQNQFMPSSFHAFAVDGNNDGKRDIWTSLPDVFASTANYLSKSGWNADERWGRAIKLPQGFPESLAGLDTKKPIKHWAGMGVTLPDGSPLPAGAGMSASIVIPDGLGGRAFLAYDNYRVIMRWNKSTYFATSVGLLSDDISR